MNRLFLMFFAAALAVFCMGSAACPPASQTDPYDTADTVISAAEAALPLADSIFNQWVSFQTDQAKIKSAQQTYTKVRKEVAQAFVLAHDAVDVARQAKQVPDVSAIMATIEKVWKDLYSFLQEITAKPTSEPGSKVKVVVEEPLKGLPKTLLRPLPAVPN